MTASLSADEARNMALRAQGLLGHAYEVRPASAVRAGAARRCQAVLDVLDHLGAVQLDTISTLARSHELVPYARIGPVGRDAVEAAYWGGGRGLAHPDRPTTVEYWSHAACLLPVSSWPWFAFRRRAFRRAGVRWHDVSADAVDGVRARLTAEGPLTTAELGGGRNGGPWWDWSAAKVAVEFMLDSGEVVCVRRVGWRRVYDLAERVLSDDQLSGRGVGVPVVDDDGVVGPADVDCVRELLHRSLRVLGVATVIDLADVHRLVGNGPASGTGGWIRAAVRSALHELTDAGAAVPVEVAGWGAPAWADPAALAALEPVAARGRTTLLSPFDSLVWDRARTARIFGMAHRLEAYTPADKRVHGYFAMPVLHGGRLVARVDPARQDGAMVARRVTFEAGPRGGVPPTAVTGVAIALREAATWVGAESVVVEQVAPAAARPALVAALGARTGTTAHGRAQSTTRRPAAAR